MFKKLFSFLFPNITVEKVEIEFIPKRYKYRIVEVLPGEYKVEWATYNEPDFWRKLPVPLTFNSIIKAEVFIDNQRVKDSFVPKVIKTYE